jgi:hypothetical protein
VVVVKSSILWYVTPCSRLKINWRFGGTCRLHLQGRRITQVRNQKVASRAIWLCWLFFDAEDEGPACSSKTPVEFQPTKRHHISEDRTRYFKWTVPTFKFRRPNLSSHELRYLEFRAVQLNAWETPFNLIPHVWRWLKPCFSIVWFRQRKCCEAWTYSLSKLPPLSVLA